MCVDLSATKMVFTNQHKAFMVEAYFRNGQKVDGVWQYSRQDCYTDFLDQYPEMACPYANFVDNLDRCVNNFRESGCITAKPRSGRPSIRSAETVNVANDIMEDDPKTSVRRLSQQIGVSVGTSHALLKKDLKLYPYRLTAVQELLPVDPPQRLEFCQWFVNTFSGTSYSSLEKSFFTDESWFTLTGYVNSQNMRTWSSENPHIFLETSLHPVKIGVWGAVSGRRLIGPIFFEGNYWKSIVVS